MRAGARPVLAQVWVRLLCLLIGANKHVSCGTLWDVLRMLLSSVRYISLESLDKPYAIEDTACKLFHREIGKTNKTFSLAVQSTSYQVKGHV